MKFKVRKKGLKILNKNIKVLGAGKPKQKTKELGNG